VAKRNRNRVEIIRSLSSAMIAFPVLNVFSSSEDEEAGVYPQAQRANCS